MKKIIKHKGKQFFIKCAYTGFGTCYDYTIYELRPNNKFFKRKYVCSGNTMWWKDTDDVEENFKQIIDEHFDFENATITQCEKIENFFKKS